MKIDVSQLPYKNVVEALERTRWMVNQFVCENGKVVLDCSPA